MSTSSANIAGPSGAADAIDGAFGVGLDYFELSANEQKRLIANATTLQEHEWRNLSGAMQTSYQSNLVAVSDLIGANLTRSVSIATKVDMWQTIGEMTEAEVSMDGETDSEEDRPEYGLNGTPVPIIHKQFRFSDRDLKTSRKLGNDLQTDGVSAATRVVAEMNENLLFNGWDVTIRGENGSPFEVHGYTTHPDRNTYEGGDWGTTSNIRDDVIAMLDALDADNRTGGGFWLYLSPTQWRQLRSAVDTLGSGDRTVRERLQDEFDQEIGALRRSSYLPDGEAVMVDPRADVIQLVRAEGTQIIEWQSPSGATDHFRVMNAMAPEIKSDPQGRSGIVHATGL